MNDDRDDKDDIKRKTRNLSEKKRRDQFNTLVNELRLLISTNNRKMDKATVLKSAIGFLKNHNDVTVRSRAHDIQEDWKPAFLSNEEFTYLVLEALEGFVMVISSTGQMYYVSETVTSLLGHNPSDIINKSIFDLTFEDDHSVLYNLLNNPTNVPETFQKNGKDNDISFQCHLRRGTLDPTEQPTYELIQFNGHFRTNVEESDIDYVPSHKESKKSVLFICTGRLYTPQIIRDVSLVNPTRSEFASRHSLELKFLFLDHRAPPIIGYLPFEVLGTSGYDYYHFDDLQKVVSCHKALMQKGELTSCYYRFLTKGQQWIWLQTRFYITYHQWNSKPEFVVCTHRVISYADITKSAKQDTAGTESASESDVNGPVREDAPQEAAVSPSYVSDSNEGLKSTYAPSTQVPDESVSGGSTNSTAMSFGTFSTMGASWDRPGRAYPNSTDNDSVSGESRNSQSMNETQKVYVGLVPQHSMGSQYLDPARFLHAVNVPENIAIALPNLPIVAPPNQAQRIDQLQRKHGELQQLLVQQQEELRRLKDLLFISKFWSHTAY